MLLISVIHTTTVYGIARIQKDSRFDLLSFLVNGNIL